MNGSFKEYIFFSSSSKKLQNISIGSNTVTSKKSLKIFKKIKFQVKEGEDKGMCLFFPEFSQ